MYVVRLIICREIEYFNKKQHKTNIDKNNQFIAETKCPYFQVLTCCLCLGHTPLLPSLHRERASFLHSMHLIMRLILTVFGGSARKLAQEIPLEHQYFLHCVFD